MEVNRERALLESYEAELRDIESQVKELMRRRDAIGSIVTGLRKLLEGPNVSPASDAWRAHASEHHAASVSTSASGAVILRAIQLLQSGRVMTAADIHARMGVSGPLSYQTLYKALRREAERSNGMIAREGDGFRLRKTNASPAANE